MCAPARPGTCDPRPPTDAEAPARLDVFAYLWALAGLFHQASFSGWRWEHPLGWLCTAGAVALLLRPGSPLALAAFAAADAAGIAYAAPRHPNHVLFSGLVDLTLVAALARPLLRRAPAREAKAALLRDAVPAIRLALGVLYFYAVFHKLNASYFDASVSCSAEMYRGLAGSLPVLPRGAAFESAAVWVVIVCEAALPLLLLRARTAVAGVVLGLAFHFALGLHPHKGVYSFSATLLPLFWLCLPPSRVARFRAPSWAGAATRAAAFGFGGAYAAVQALRWTGRVADDAVYAANLRAGQFLWAAATAAAAWVLAENLRRTRGAPAEPQRLLPACAPFSALPLLVFANGLCPYLGFKTESSFAMFSNLRTEGGRGNHLLVPDGVQVTDWARDVVEVVDCSRPEVARLPRERLATTRFQLRLLRSRAQGAFRVEFTSAGATFVYDSERPETHGALPEVPFVLTKLCQFRPVDLGERVRCRH